MKRIAICCDGTWDKASNNTNVNKISEIISRGTGPDGIEQLVYYHPGVGTSGNIFQRMAGGIAGADLDNHIMEAYGDVVDHYEPGDQLFFFGFSRGAYTVRSLAGFIRKCGILKPENKDQIAAGFAIYRTRDEPEKADSPAAVQFRDAYSYPAAVYFIGVWDTVGDLGVPLKWFQFFYADKYKFHDAQLSSIVRFAYQAIGVDEHRKIFNVTMWERSDHAIANKVNQPIEQVWFTGAHGNIGGGYSKPSLSHRTLLWMISKASGAGLRVEDRQFPVDANYDDYLVESNTGIWWVLDGFSKFYRTLMAPQYPGQSIDPSVYERKRLNTTYQPQNLPPQ